LAEAKTGEFAGMAQGELVAGGGSFLKSPGKKNDAGETVALALIPPQPLVIKARGTSRIASHINFQFILTCLV
jgi:hypothetical protein